MDVDERGVGVPDVEPVVEEHPHVVDAAQAAPGSGGHHRNTEEARVVRERLLHGIVLVSL